MMIFYAIKPDIIPESLPYISEFGPICARAKGLAGRAGAATYKASRWRARRRLAATSSVASQAFLACSGMRCKMRSSCVRYA